MFESIKAFFKNLWQSITSFFTRKPVFTAPVYTDKEKYDFVVYLLSGQKGDSGFALRHVKGNATKNANVRNGFHGDAISYSITSYIMSLALNKMIKTCSWCFLESGEVSYMTDTMTKPAILDESLAVTIFDCLHEKILQFLGLNFSEQSHHFMFLKDMGGANSPYDIKTIYPTGKAGKQSVLPTQILKVFSKEDNLESKEEMIHAIESGIFSLASSSQSKHDKSSTVAILSVLREVKLRADEKKLSLDTIRRRLVEAELETNWSNNKYRQFYDKGGYVEQFSQSFAEVNNGLDHFRALM